MKLDSLIHLGYTPPRGEITMLFRKCILRQFRKRLEAAKRRIEDNYLNFQYEEIQRIEKMLRQRLEEEFLRRTMTLIDEEVKFREEKIRKQYEEEKQSK